MTDDYYGANLISGPLESIREDLEARNKWKPILFVLDEARGLFKEIKDKSIKVRFFHGENQ